MSVDELLSIMILNQLPQQFDTIKKIKRHDAKAGNKVPTIQEIVEDIKDDMKNRHQNHNVVNFAGQSGGGDGSGKGKGKGKGKGNGKWDGNAPRCTYKPCEKLGHKEDNCAMKYPERREEILKAAKEAKEKRQKDKEKGKSKDKENSGDEKKKGAWDVQIITALNTQDPSAVPTPPDDEIRDLHQMIEELKVLVDNKALKNKTTVLRTVKIGSIWHTIIDSGAQRTIFSNRELLHDYIEQEDFCQTGFGEVLRCSGKGTVIFDLEGPDGTIKWRLHNVLWCPELGHNLLGTLPLGKSDISVLLKPEGKPTELQKNGICFGYADIINEQYVIRGRPIEKDSVQACIVMTSQQLHQRMGHLNWNSVKELPKHARGIELQGSQSDQICGPCMKGHQRLNIGHSPMPKATRPLQFIHTDLGGPYPMSRGQHRYYISFLDDFSGCIWINLLKKKSDAFAAFKHFKAMVENQSEGLKISFLRSDRGEEYIDQDFQKFLKENGIKWEPAAAGWPNSERP